jgi:hypothetical protein
LAETRPVVTCFFCTGKDLATGAPGSRVQIEGKGTPVEVRRRGDTVEKLPNIPVQAGLEADAFEVCEVPADDLDVAVGVMLRAVADLEERFPGANLVADYTGGTKTMTAALVVAALESERVALRLVTGTRGDLVKVRDGSETGLAVSAEGIRLRRAMAPYLAAWGRYAYGESADGLARLASPRAPEHRAQLQIARDLSRAFDAWDRFDHRRALSLCADYRPRIGPKFGLAFKFLEILATPGHAVRTPARLWDLWLNAQRRTAQGRYDDAVARLYRLLEWTAQWLLLDQGIDTADIRPDQLPDGVLLEPGRDGRTQAGLFAAWDLVARCRTGPAAEFALQERDRMRDHIRARNESILAHGDTPVDAVAWERFRAWADNAFIPVLKKECHGAGFRMEPAQLPTAPPWRDQPGAPDPDPATEE